MSRSALSVTWYWFRVNLARRITSYLAVVLLVGLIGGIAIGSLSAARRTKSSFDVFLASTNPSDMSVLLAAPNLTKKISHLPLVQRVAGGGGGAVWVFVARRTPHPPPPPLAPR